MAEGNEKVITQILNVPSGSKESTNYATLATGFVPSLFIPAHEGNVRLKAAYAAEGTYYDVWEPDGSDIWQLAGTGSAAVPVDVAAPFVFLKVVTTDYQTADRKFYVGRKRWEVR